MNGYLIIFLGLAVIAVGTALTIYGTQSITRADSEGLNAKVDSVLAAIANAQKSIADVGQGGRQGSATNAPGSAASTASIRDAQNKLSDIEQDFSSWVSNYIKDRDLKKLTLERQRLEARGREIQVSKEYRPALQLLIDDVRAAIRAYNTKTGAAISVELKDLPSNLYEPDSNYIELGTVQFPPDVKWNFSLTVIKPASPERGLPYLQIDVRSAQSHSEDSLRLIPVPPDLVLQRYGGGIMSAADLPNKCPIASADECIRKVVQALIETQLSSLPGQ